MAVAFMLLGCSGDGHFAINNCQTLTDYQHWKHKFIYAQTYTYMPLTLLSEDYNVIELDITGDYAQHEDDNLNVSFIEKDETYDILKKDTIPCSIETELFSNCVKAKQDIGECKESQHNYMVCKKKLVQDQDKYEQDNTMGFHSVASTVCTGVYLLE